MTSKKAKYGIYRSGLEKTFAELIPPKTMQYEPYPVPYTMYRDYTPHFVFDDWLFVECKGFFRQGDTLKYKSIRDSLDYEELVFVLSDPNKKIRKGAKMTMGQWCEKEDLKFYTVSTVDELLAYATSI